jgi:ribosomal protein S18 acetylase RimI-like enzyme
MSQAIASQRNEGAGDAGVVRPTNEGELDHLARLWFDAWHETHAPVLPADLTKLRTLESFRDRLHHGLADIRVVGPSGAPIGFCWIRGAELYQLFLSPAARGAAVATGLLADAEARLRANGVATAHLGCAIGNDRAARFYEKHGWRRVGAVVEPVDTSNGPYVLEVWRYEKSL